MSTAAFVLPVDNVFKWLIFSELDMALWWTAATNLFHD